MFGYKGVWVREEGGGGGGGGGGGKGVIIDTCVNCVQEYDCDVARVAV